MNRTNDQDNNSVCRGKSFLFLYHNFELRRRVHMITRKSKHSRSDVAAAWEQSADYICRNSHKEALIRNEPHDSRNTVTRILRGLSTRSWVTNRSVYRTRRNTQV